MRAIGIAVIGLTAALVLAQQPPAGSDTSAASILPPQRAGGQAATVRPEPAKESAKSGLTDDIYQLGPGDQVLLHVAETEERAQRPLLVDPSGFIRVPLIGRVRVGGLSVVDAEAVIVEKLKVYFIKPAVVLTIAEYGSQPVSVIGAVKQPGVQQVRGRKNLVEVLSMAGGLDTTAGTSIRITRRIAYGEIPLPSAATDPTGQFSVAEVNLKSLMQAKNPEENVAIKPHDVLAIPTADTVYVIGEVQKSGGYTYGERTQVTVLQALSMAGGLARTAKPKDSRLLRLEPDGTSRREIAIDLQRILDGRIPDVPMSPEDILYVPDNVPKRAMIRALETALQLGTGVVIWR